MLCCSGNSVTTPAGMARNQSEIYVDVVLAVIESVWLWLITLISTNNAV